MKFGDRLWRIQIIEQCRFDGRRQAFALITNRGFDKGPENIAAFLKSRHGPVDRLPIMATQHVEANHIAGPVVQHIPDRHEVSERFRHLLALDLQEAVV